MYSAHSMGLRTVITGLEAEVEQLNREYVHALESGPRDREQDRQALERKLQGVLKQIDKKTKQIETLK